MDDINLQGLTGFKNVKKLARSPFSNNLKHFVLETDPTPDYYARGNFPPNKRDRNMHYYMPIKNQLINFHELVLTQVAEINKKLGTDFHINPAIIMCNRRNYHSLRIRANDTERLEEMITELHKIGLEFLKDTKVAIYETTITYLRYTEFIELQENIYAENGNPFRYYFRVGKYYKINEYLEKMDIIKHNCDFHLFDSFFAYTLNKTGIVNFAGVYSENCDKNRFPELLQHINEQFA